MRNWATIARTKALLRAADRTYDEASLNVAFDVTRRFYEVVRAERSLKVFQEAVTRSEELVRRTDALYEAGRAPRSDTYAARVTLGNDRISAEQQLARVSDARVALSIALGRGADPGLRVVPPATLDRTSFQEPPDQPALVDLARRKRPVLSADEQRTPGRRAGDPCRTGRLLPERLGAGQLHAPGAVHRRHPGRLRRSHRPVRGQLRHRRELEPLRGPDHQRQRPARQPDRGADPSPGRAGLPPGDERDRARPASATRPSRLRPRLPRKISRPPGRACSSPSAASTPAPPHSSRSATPCSTSPGPSSPCWRPGSTPSSPAPT